MSLERHILRIIKLKHRQRQVDVSIPMFKVNDTMNLAVMTLCKLIASFQQIL